MGHEPCGPTAAGLGGWCDGKEKAPCPSSMGPSSSPGTWESHSNPSEPGRGIKFISVTLKFKTAATEVNYHKFHKGSQTFSRSNIDVCGGVALKSKE